MAAKGALDRLRERYGSTAKATTSSQSFTQNTQAPKTTGALDRFREKYGDTLRQKAAQDVGTSYKQYISDYKNFASEAEKALKNAGYSTAKMDQASRVQVASKLRQQASTLETQLRWAKSSMTEDSYTAALSDLESTRKSVDDIMEAFNSNVRYFDQWETEDEYNTYVAEQKAYEAKRDFDTGAGAKEIAQLQQILKDFKAVTQYSAGGRADELRAEEFRSKYGSPQELENLIGQKQAYLNDASRVQKGIAMAGVADPDSGTYDSEFSQYAQAGTKKLGILMQALKDFKAVTQYSAGGQADEQKAEELRSKYGSPQELEELIGRDLAELGDRMTKDEFAVYSYHYMKSGPEAAQEYLDSIRETLNYRSAQEKYGSYEGETAAEFAFAAVAGLEQFGSNVKNLFSKDDYIPTSETQYLSGMIREDLADNGPKLPEWAGGASLGQVAYDAINTTANMAPSILTSLAIGTVSKTAGSAVGLGLMGTSAAGGAYQEKLNLGYSKAQAGTYAAMVGASEMVLEKILGGVTKLGGNALSKTVLKGLGQVDNVMARVATQVGNSAAGRILSSMGSEAIEEGLQTVLEPVLWNVVSGEEIDVEKEEVLYSALLGAVTGGVFEGAEVVSSAISDKRAAQKPVNGAESGVLENAGSVPAAATDAAEDVSGAFSANENTAPEGGVQYSLREFGDGKRFVEVDQDQSRFDGHSPDEYPRIAKDIINEKFNGRVIGADNKMFVNGSGRDEFANPSKHLGSDLYEAKMRTAGELDNLLDAGTNFRNAPDGADGHVHPDVVGGFDYYDTLFKIGNRYFKAVVNIKNVKRGKLFKDVTKIEDVTQDIMSSYGNNPKSQFLRTSSKDSIRNNSGNVNTGGENVPDESGKAHLKSTGEAVGIMGVASAKNGEMKLKLEDGRVVDAKEVEYGSAEEAVIYETVAGLGTDALSANLLIENYVPGDKDSALVYAKGVEEAYLAGAEGYPLSELNNAAFASRLAENQRWTAYELGKIAGGKQAKAEAPKAPAPRTARKRGYVKTRGMTRAEIQKVFNRSQKDAYAVLNRIAEVTGIDMVLYRSKADAKGNLWAGTVDGIDMGGSQGAFSWDNDKIYIDVNAGVLNASELDDVARYSMLRTFTHEFAHFFEKWNPEQWAVLRDAVFSTMRRNGTDPDVLIDKYMKEHEGTTRDAAAREVVAEAMVDILPQSSFVQELAQKHRNIFEKLLERLKEFVEKIKAHFNSIGASRSQESEAVKEYVDGVKKYADELVELFDKIAVQAVENYQTAETAQKNTVPEGGVQIQYQLREYSEQQKENWKTSKRIVVYNSRSQLMQFIQDSIANKTMDKKMYFGAIPSDLAGRIQAETGLDLENYNLSLGSYEVRKILKDHGNENKEAPRGQRAVVADDFEHITEIVLNPTKIELSEDDYMGKPAIVFTGNHNGRMNVVAVVSDKRLDLFVQTVFVNVKKGNLATPTGDQAPVNTPEANSGTVSSIDSIRNKREIVNTNSSGVQRQDRVGNTPGGGVQMQARPAEKQIDISDNKVYDAGVDDIRNLVYRKHQPGQDIVEFDHEAWEKRKAEASKEYGLTPEEANGLEGYVGGKAYSWNAILRGDSNYERRAFDDFWISQATNGLNKFPRFDGRTYRNLSFADKEGLNQFVKGHKAGEAVEISYFASSSKDPNGYTCSGDYVAHMVIDGFSGRDISESYSLPGQKEVVYLPGTKLHIVSVMTANDGNPLIYAQEVKKNGKDMETDSGRYGQGPAGTNKEGQAGDAGRKGNDLGGVHQHGGMEGDGEGLNALPIQQPGRFHQTEEVNKKAYAPNETEQFQDRVGTLTNWDILEQAADIVGEQKLAEGQREAINSFNEHLEKVKRLSVQKAQLYSAIDTAAESEKKAMRSRIAELNKQINAETKAMFELENTPVLKRVLNNARAVIEEEQAAKRREGMAKYRDQRNRTEMRHKIQKVVKKLNDLLLHESKERHVPENMKKAVSEALDIINMDTVGAEERLAKYDALIAKETDPDVIASLTETRGRIAKAGERFNDRISKLKAAYDSIKSGAESGSVSVYDEVIANKIQEVVEDVGDTALRDMSLAQLDAVYEMYTMVAKSISNANKSFKEAKGATITQMGAASIREVKAAGKSKQYSPAALEAVKKFGWDNLKPYYAFSLIGSDTLAGLYDNVRKGEDVWARDVESARSFFREQAKKHGYDDWGTKKEYSFTDVSGRAFKLSLPQIMSLYAYSKRAQADKHLEKGGFVFDSAVEVVQKKRGIPVKYKVNTADAYNLTREQINQIVGTLTREQVAFADVMQDYLSTVMGEKGNEVSLALYDVRLFKEKNYFPLKSAAQYTFQQTENAGEVKLKNSGFSKKTVDNASNPIILSDFMSVWGSHVNDMSTYHAFVLPLEDFNRVYNYKTLTSEEVSTQSVKAALQNVYGTASTRYIKQMLEDINGGARADDRAAIMSRWMGKFKKGSVFANASVVIQQPSAIARAAALVDLKHFFVGKLTKQRHKQLWEEVKRYAPVAIIKEMGYFDTNMGLSTAEYLTAKDYNSIGEKAKAIFADSDYRDELLSRPAALADELSWCYIWEAVKRETREKNPGMDTQSEAFLRKAGDRFTEVVTRTQVYDSVLSRSGLMRSKDTGVKMMTAFMAEPTTSMNMVVDALVQGKRGDRWYARNAVGAVLASQVLNAILVSFVYAARDDDEDESYWEKYLASFSGKMLDSINPLAYLPFVKDVVSIVRGYSVERSDMAVISDIWTAWQKLSSEKVSPYRKIEDFAGSVAQVFGVPVKNIMRDVRAIYQTVDSALNGPGTTAMGIWTAVREEVSGKDIPRHQQLYEAMVGGDEDYLKRIEATYEDEAAPESAVRKGLREFDARISEAAQARVDGDFEEYERIFEEIEDEGHFTHSQIAGAVQAEIDAMGKDEESSSAAKPYGMYSIDDFMRAVYAGDADVAANARDEIQETAQANGKSAERAERSFVSAAVAACKEWFLDGAITQDQAVDVLAQWCGRTESEAKADVAYWSYGETHSGQEGSAQWFDTYYEKIESSGIDIDTYVEYRNRKSEYTKKDEILEIIDALPISSKQKDALYFAEGWAKSTLDEAPWH